MADTQQAEKDYASEFMLQEHNRIIDAYHDLHVQKNELVKFYLAFASLPLSIVAIFLSLFKYIQTTAQSGSLLNALQIAAVGLAILLVFVGISVLMIMLRIRGEQYLYVKTVNGTRRYFKERHNIPEEYLVLPFRTDVLTFSHEEKSGRAFWEAMIVGSTSSLLLAFLAGRLALSVSCFHDYWWLLGLAVFFLSGFLHVWFVKRWLQHKLGALGLGDVAGRKGSA